MYVAQPGHIDHIKRNNAGSVYKLIDLYGPISRIELSKRSQLAPASITKITRELIDAHLIKETQFQEPSSRGRPAIGLVPANEGWQFLSIRLTFGSNLAATDPAILYLILFVSYFEILYYLGINFIKTFFLM